VREAGGKLFVDLKVDVPRRLSFEEIHQLTQKAHESVRKLSPDADAIVDAET